MAKAVKASTRVLQAIPGVCCVAGPGATLVDVCFTVQARVSWGAVTVETTHQVHTGTVVQASGTQVQGRAWATVILIDLTQHSQCPRGTGAQIAGHEVNAGAPMLAGLRSTLVHIILTVVTRVASWTLTHVAPHVASAGAPVLAGLGQAGVHLLLTVAAGATLRAHTGMGAALVHTLPACLTQMFQPHASLGCRLHAG